MVIIGLTSEEAAALARLFQTNGKCPDHQADILVNSQQIAQITSRSASTVRRWATREDAPLYGVLQKIAGTLRSEWVATVGDVFDRRGAVISYKSGPKSGRL